MSAACCHIYEYSANVGTFIHAFIHLRIHSFNKHHFWFARPFFKPFLKRSQASPRHRPIKNPNLNLNLKPNPIRNRNRNRNKSNSWTPLVLAA